jgi:serine/threonine protein kinase
MALPVESLAYTTSRRNLKGTNILLTPDGDVKLSDYGFSRMLRLPGSIESDTLSKFDVLTRKLPNWTAPEV